MTKRELRELIRSVIKEYTKNIKEAASIRREYLKKELNDQKGA